MKSCFVLLTAPSRTKTRRCSDSKKDFTDIVLLLSTLDMVREFSDSLGGGGGGGEGRGREDAHMREGKVEREREGGRERGRGGEKGRG